MRELTPQEKEIEAIAAQPRETIIHPDHCNCCGANAVRGERFLNFLVAIIRGVDTRTYEPMCRDGIFDDKGKIARLHCCLTCAPKIKRFHARKDPKVLPPGQLRELCMEIDRRQRGNWEGLCLS